MRPKSAYKSRLFAVLGQHRKSVSLHFRIFSSSSAFCVPTRMDPMPEGLDEPPEAVVLLKVRQKAGLDRPKSCTKML